MLATATGSTYNVVWIVVGAFALVEGLKAALGWASRRIIRNKNVDDLIAARAQIAAVDKKVSANGKDTDNVGDVAKRIEDKFDDFRRQFDRNRDSVNRRLRALEKHAGIVQ